MKSTKLSPEIVIEPLNIPSDNYNYTWFFVFNPYNGPEQGL